MSVYRGPYYSADGCDGVATPGAKALMSWYLGAYRARGAANLGIYVCKRLGSGWSIHAEGRACDLGTAPYNNPGHGWPDWGWAVANALQRNSAELGIQLVIFRRHVWSCRKPDAGWRQYTGSDPHDGHLHAELTPHAAATLTVDRIERIIGGSPSLEDIIMQMDLPKYGDKGTWVGFFQRLVIDRGATLPKYGVDKSYGDEFAAALRWWWRNIVKSSSAYDGRLITDDVARHLMGLERTAPAPIAPTQAQVDAAVAKFLAANPVKVPDGVSVNLGTVTGTLFTRD